MSHEIKWWDKEKNRHTWHTARIGARVKFTKAHRGKAHTCYGKIVKLNPKKIVVDVPKVKKGIPARWVGKWTCDPGFLTLRDDPRKDEPTPVTPKKPEARDPWDIWDGLPFDPLNDGEES